MHAYIDCIADMLGIADRAKHDLGVIAIMNYGVNALLHERKGVVPWSWSLPTNGQT